MLVQGSRKAWYWQDQNEVHLESRHLGIWYLAGPAVLCGPVLSLCVRHGMARHPRTGVQAWTLPWGNICFKSPFFLDEHVLCEESILIFVCMDEHGPPRTSYKHGIVNCNFSMGLAYPSQYIFGMICSWSLKRWPLQHQALQRPPPFSSLFNSASNWTLGSGPLPVPWLRYGILFLPLLIDTAWMVKFSLQTHNVFSLYGSEVSIQLRT